MEYTVEEISPVRKKMTIKVPAEEVDGAIAGALALYKKNVQLDGFRKGKVPASVIEKRYHDSIYKNAREDLLNVHFNDILDKEQLKPVGPIIEPGQTTLEKGAPYEYEIEFDVMPSFDLPVYEGLEVDEEKVTPSPEIVEQMLKRLQRGRSTLEVAEGSGPAKDGNVANIDFETMLDGKQVEEFQVSGFDLEINEYAALPEFIEFVKTIPVGHTAEKTIHFPDDFVAPKLAGKDAEMKVTVHAVKERKLPALDDSFAEKSGKKNMEELRQSLMDSYMDGMRALQKSVTQKKLLDMLVKQTDFALPQSMVEMNLNLVLGDMIGKAESQGKNIASTPEELEKLKEEAMPAAAERTREKILLLEIAKKENLDVSPAEVEKQIARRAMGMGMDVQSYFDKMRDTGMIFQLRDTMVSDKAMDLVYERAKVNLVEPARAGGESSATEAKEAGAVAGEENTSTKEAQ